MKPDFRDISTRIPQEPLWYTVEGVPRYDRYVIGDTDIYADYGLLVLVLCQQCAKPFLIGDCFSQHRGMQVKLNWDLLDEDAQKWFKDPDEAWVNYKSGLYAPTCLGPDGKKVYRTPTLEEYVHGWGYGDPPAHGCVGDTMGCVEWYSVEVWDKRFGQEVGPSSTHPSLQVITKPGVMKRITELEGHHYEHEWLDSNPQHKARYEAFDVGSYVLNYLSIPYTPAQVGWINAYGPQDNE